MRSETSNPNRLFEYRIKYNAGVEHCAMDNYHYYMAETGDQALSFHLTMIEMKHLTVQNVSVEKFNPWSEQWEDESEVLNRV